MTGSDRAIGVIRQHTFGLAAGPRPRLRAVLGRVLLALDERLGRSRVRRGHHPIDFIWHRPSPLVLLRENRIHQGWNLSATVILNAAGTVAARASGVAARTVARPPSAIAAPVPRLTMMVERRIETRVVDRTATVFRASMIRRPLDDARPATRGAAPSPRHLLAVRTDAPVTRSEMVVAKAAVSAPAATPATPTRSADSAVPPLSRSTERSIPPAAAAPLERITAEVIRALDARVIAWRERMGRS
jgi:hypothetical protein